MANVTIFKKREIWWMQYRINGTRVRKSLSTKNEKTAHKLARIQEDKILLGECEGHKGRIKYDTFWEVFLPFSTTSKRRKTVDNEIRIWKRFSEWLKSKGMKYLDQITPVIFENYRLSLLNLGLSQSTVNIAHRHLASILTFAVRHGYLTANPLHRIPKYKLNQEPPRYLKQDEIQHLMQIAEQQSKEIHIVCALGLFAGFRRNEICHSRWEWFDLETKTILIQPYGDFAPKNHRIRPIPMNQKLQKILMKYQKDTGYLLESEIDENSRKCLVRWDFKNSFNILRKRAELEWVTPHIMRHTFASQLAKAGVSLYKIQQWLGHSDPKTTMIYAHLQAQDEEIDLI